MLTRKVYKRGNSYSTSLPRLLFLGLKSADKVYFEFSNGKWYAGFEEKKGLNVVSRKILKRTSFEVTLPSEILFNTKKKTAEFSLEGKRWRIKVE